MIVLHAGVEAGQFLLWGEAPVDSQTVPRKRRGRKAKVAPAPPLPYDAGPERLTVALEAVPGFVTDLPKPETATAWLPTVDGVPVASTPLVAEPPEPGPQAVVAPWTVSVLRLPYEQVVDLLCACVDKEALAPGVVVGKTLAYWATALRWAGALVTRQQFLPGEQAAADRYRARWEPVLAAAEAQRLTQLAKAMPAAGRALTRAADTAPAPPAAAVLSAFLGEMTDQLVRAAVAPARQLAPAERRPRRGAPAFASIHDQWLHALRAPSGDMTGEAAELNRLADQIHDWRRPLALTAAAPFRLCFRLEEPPANGDGETAIAPAAGPWYVRYLLQAADDPSLLVPVADVWTAKGRQAALLRRGAFDPREYLLSALGQASAVCPGVEDSLKTATPAGYELDTAGAHDFLTDKAWLLEQAGFGVHLPAWWTRKGTKLRLSVWAHVKSPPMQSGGGLSLEQVLKFDWQVALGDQPLALAELEALARLKAPLVKIRGQWVQLSAEEIQAAIAFWKKKAEGSATVRDVVQMALGAARAPGGMAFAGVEATGWVGELLDRLEGRGAFAELPPPEGFLGQLRPYQVRGYSWLGFLRQWGLGACLADDMGLGKTIQTLALVQRDWEANGKCPVLLICPMSVVGNWQKEAARFTPDLPVLVHHGVEREKGPDFKKLARQHALVLSSYALLHRDFDVLKEVPWAGVVLDEAQNIKNPQTKQAQAARALPGDYRVALTGTPVENHVGDLWSIMEFLNPGFLGNQAEFKRTFFVPIQANRDPDAARRLQRLTGPFILRRLKTDKTIIADLPDKLEMKVFCTLTKEQASLYAAVVGDTMQEIEEATGIHRKGLVLATLSKLKQVCNHPAQFLGDNSPIPGRSGKLARLTEMLEEALSEGDRALVFTQFAEMGELIRRHLQETFGREVLFLHGGVAKKQRDRLVARFQGADGPRVFVLSLKAGGTGLNLTAANHVFHFDRWWNPAVENQATDRAFRIGQTRNVQVHKFLCAGTLEEKIDDMIERKQEVAARTVGSGEGWLTELSTAELKDLFALRQEALGE
jgi:SNF2 family DNA or RNA helicase